MPTDSKRSCGTGANFNRYWVLSILWQISLADWAFIKSPCRGVGDAIAAKGVTARGSVCRLFQAYAACIKVGQVGRGRGRLWTTGDRGPRAIPRRRAFAAGAPVTRHSSPISQRRVGTGAGGTARPRVTHHLLATIHKSAGPAAGETARPRSGCRRGTLGTTSVCRHQTLGTPV